MAVRVRSSLKISAFPPPTEAAEVLGAMVTVLPLTAVTLAPAAMPVPVTNMPTLGAVPPPVSVRVGLAMINVAVLATSNPNFREFPGEATLAPIVFVEMVTVLPFTAVTVVPAAMPVPVIDMVTVGNVPVPVSVSVVLAVGKVAVRVTLLFTP